MKQSDQSENSVSVTWEVKDQSRISGYVIRLLKNENIIDDATNVGISNTAVSYTFEKLQPGNQYKVNLRTFLKIANELIESEQTNTSVSTGKVGIFQCFRIQVMMVGCTRMVTIQKRR